MRSLVVIIAFAALAGAGCSRPQTQAAAAAASPADQALDQALSQSMNRFAKADLNGDGKLTADEISAATQGGDPTVKDARAHDGFSARAMKIDDANGDGVVTREEAETATRAQVQSRMASSGVSVTQ